MGRAVAIILVLGSLTLFLNVYTQGVEGAFGGALARLWQDDEPKPRWPAEPVPRRTVSDGVDRDGTTPQPIGQRVRERVNRAMEAGTQRYSGED